MDDFLGSSRAYFTGFGLVAVILIACKFVYSLWKIFRTFVLSRILGPNVDLKKMGDWAAITGSTDGIGRAYAEALAARGLGIILISRNPSKLETVAAEIRKQYQVTVKTVTFDFLHDADHYNRLQEELQGLEIGVLVNNVAHGMLGAFLETEQKDVEDVIAVNAVGLTRMTRMVLPGMVQRRKGVIVNICSATGDRPWPYCNVYSATKAFIDFFSRNLAIEYKDKGVIIQSVVPHMVLTNPYLPVGWKPSVFLPVARDYVRAAICTLGHTRRTYGYLPHAILGVVARLLSDELHYTLMVKGPMDEIRNCYMAANKEKKND